MEIDHKTKQAMIEFVEEELEVGFHGGFASSIEKTGISDSTLKEWVRKAALFKECSDPSFSERQKNDYFILLTDLYSSAWLEYSSGGGIADVDIEDIVEGNKLDLDELESSIELAVHQIKENGIELDPLVKKHIKQNLD